MNNLVRMIAVVVAALIPAVALSNWETSIGSLTPIVPESPLPDRIGEWTATAEEHLDEGTLAMISPDVYALRRYEAPGRTPIWLYVGMYGARSAYDKSAHDPEVCFPAHGWEIMDSGALDIDVAGEHLTAKLMDAQRGAENEAVLFWFQPAGRWSSSEFFEQILRVADSVSGRPQYAFVRLSGPVSKDADNVRDLSDFAAEVAPIVRNGVDGIRG